jgi:hypothetical protein
MELLGAIISEYKSVDRAEVPLSGLTVLYGPNGAGKTNLLEALGAHDPLARAALHRAGGLDVAHQARVGLVARFDVTSAGTGPDAAALLEMISAPWAANIPARDIPDGIGAYCGSCWWLNGGDLYSDASRASLEEAYRAIRAALLASVPDLLQDPAGQFLDLLLEDPVLIVQEDFAVELGCDRASARGRELAALSRALEEMPDGVFAHLLGPLDGWAGRWPPLTLLTRGPGARGTGAPVGFGWITNRLGGVQVVSGEADNAEIHLDQALEQAHDRLQHRHYDEEPEWGDAICDVCLRADHGGRVDPEWYPLDNSHTDYSELPFPFRGSPEWLEERDGWTRLRPTLRDTLAIVEEQANERAPSFVAEFGRIRLDTRPVRQWDASVARCRIMFDISPGEGNADDADSGGELGAPDSVRSPDNQVLNVHLADLGAGLRRWVATAVRQAADACATGEFSANRWLGAGCDSSEPPRVVGGEQATPRILIIDEPEQHLHPYAQETIAAWAIQQAAQHHAVVIASHSPAFLALPPEHATICQVRRVGHITRIDPLPEVHGGDDVVARARQLGFDLGLGREALAQLTRAVVVVEGEWDRQMLRRFYGAKFRQQRILVVPLQGSDELSALADAAVIPALGVPVVALLDEVRASSWEDLASLPGTLSKAERCLRDLAADLGSWLQVVRYEDPDIICALPENAVTAAYPDAKFPGWGDLLASWHSAVASQDTTHSFKRWALEAMELPRKQRFPSAFFRQVLNHSENSIPGDRLNAAVEQILSHINAFPGNPDNL